MPEYDNQGREITVDRWGDRCVIDGRCPRCQAPRLLRETLTGNYSSQFHEPHCTGGPLGAWHGEARAAMHESQNRDYKQIEHRKREYGANVEPPAGYRDPTLRAPRKTGTQ